MTYDAPGNVLTVVPGERPRTVVIGRRILIYLGANIGLPKVMSVPTITTMMYCRMRMVTIAIIMLEGIFLGIAFLTFGKI